MPNHQAQSIQEFLEVACRGAGSKTMFTVLEYRDRQKDPEFISISGLDFLGAVEDCARRQRVSGIGPSSRVAFIGDTSLALLKNFFACLLNGAVVCPMDTKLSEPEISSLLKHFEPTHVVISDEWWERASRIDLVREMQAKLITHSQLEKFPEAFLKALPDLKPEGKACELVIYTSGTSGTPKGVVIHLDSVFFEAQRLSEAFPGPDSGRVSFSILPLNHIYGLAAAIFASMWSDKELCLTQSFAPNHLAMIYKERKVNRVIVVPLLLSMIKNEISAKVRAQPFLKRFLFSFFLTLNRKLNSPWVARVFFGAVRRGLSESVDFFISGGAPLDRSMCEFFQGLGWPTYNGYGLTETGPVISVNSTVVHKNGTAGKVLPGVEVQIVKQNNSDESGEIWVRGANIFQHYYKDPKLTSELKDAEGWFKTGDLGYLDRDGFLSVTGRSKSMIVLSTGKKVQPEEVEELLQSSPFVKNSCLIVQQGKGLGDKLVVVIQLNDDVKDDGEEIQKEIRMELLKLCERLAPFKRPHEFRFRSEPFELTSSQKVKRYKVQAEYGEKAL